MQMSAVEATASWEQAMRERYADYVDHLTELTADVDIPGIKAELARTEHQRPVKVVSGGLPGHGKRS